MMANSGKIHNTISRNKFECDYLLQQCCSQIVPFVGPIGGYLTPGNTIRVQGITHPSAQR